MPREGSADTILERLAQWSRTQPDKPCFTFCDGKMRESARLTFGELERVTRTLAERLLSEYGLHPGDRVLLVYPPSLDFIAAFLACLRAGCVAVPVFPPIPGQLKKDLHHFASIHGSSGAKVALTNTQYNYAKRVVQIKEKFSRGKLKWPSDIRWIVTDKDLDIKAKATQTAGKNATAPALKEASAFDREDLAFLQYTSGSTSEPKGVMITHGNLAHNHATIIEALGADQNTSCVSWLPQYHDMGLIGSYLGTLYCGGSGFYMSPISFVKQPVMWIEMMSKYKATHTQAPNFAFKLAVRKYNEMPESKRPRDLDLSNLRHMFNAAEPVTIDAIVDFEATFCPHGLPRGVIVPGYGLAEHTVYVCDRGRQRVRVSKRALLEEHRAEVIEVLRSNSDDSVDDDKRDDTSLSEGKSDAAADDAGQILIGVGFNRGIDVRIVDKETRREVPDAGMVGEIWVNSPSKARGYFGKDELSKDVFFAELVAPEADNDDEGAEVANKLSEEEAKQGEPSTSRESAYLRTGDLGFMYNEELFICGRDKDLIIIRGRNHYPQDIEKTVEGEEETRIRGGCSAAFSVTAGVNEDGAVGGCEEEVLIVVAEARDPQKYKDHAEFSLRLAKRVAQDHGVGVHKPVLVKPRSIDKTSSGKIARQWVRKAYLAQSLDVIAESSSATSETLTETAQGTNAGETKNGDRGDKKKNTTKRVTGTVQTFDAADLDNRLRIMASEMAEGELDPDGLSMDLSLVELGLGSMQVVQLAGQIGEEFGMELDEEEMFSEDMTLGKMKRLILAQQEGGSVSASAPKVKPVKMEVKAPAPKVKKKSTLEIVFCFCCNSSGAGQKTGNNRTNAPEDTDF